MTNRNNTNTILLLFHYYYTAARQYELSDNNRTDDIIINYLYMAKKQKIEKPQPTRADLQYLFIVHGEIIFFFYKKKFPSGISVLSDFPIIRIYCLINTHTTLARAHIRILYSVFKL